MIDSHDYQIHLRATGPRAGTVTAEQDDLPPMGVAAPPEFRGPGATWTPEHLFVAAVSGCLMTTFQTIAEMSKLDFSSYTDEPVGHLVREDSLYRMASVTLRPTVTVADASTVDRVHRLLEKAERACLISRSINAEVHLEPTVQVED